MKRLLFVSLYIQTCTDAPMNTKIKGEFATPYQFSHYSLYFKVGFLIRETKSVFVLPSKLVHSEFPLPSSPLIRFSFSSSVKSNCFIYLTC